MKPKTQKILISGMSGYLGTQVSQELTNRKHGVQKIERELLYGPTRDLAAEISGNDIVINLAGASILRRWTRRNRELIYNSRVATSHNLVEAIRLLPPGERPRKIITASAIGLYKAGFSHNEESTNFDQGFLGKVVRDWEKQWEKLPHNVEQTIFRIGPLIGKQAQIIRLAKLPFSLGLGGRIASGEQPFPFIHEADLVAAFVEAVESDRFKGTFNLAAPDKINNATFTSELAGILHRPAFIPLPDFALRLIFGEAAEMLTSAPEVSSDKLEQNGFRFRYPDIRSALQQALR